MSIHHIQGEIKNVFRHWLTHSCTRHIRNHQNTAKLSRRWRENFMDFRRANIPRRRDDRMVLCWAWGQKTIGMAVFKR